MDINNVPLSVGSNRNVVGAGSENRTRATRSEAWHSTTKLYPHFLYSIIYKKKKQPAKFNFVSCSLLEQVVGIEPT